LSGWAGITQCDYGDKLAYDYDREIADETVAIRLNPMLATAYFNRSLAYDNKAQQDRAIPDYDKVIELNPEDGYAYFNRGSDYVAKGDHAKASADFRIAALLIPTSDPSNALAVARADVQGRFAAASLALPPPPKQASRNRQPRVGYTGRSTGRGRAHGKSNACGNSRSCDHCRLSWPPMALVIGNSAYSAVGKLANPQRDAEAIASVLKADGFEVTQASNVTRAGFITIVNRFSDAAANADWAMIYFAGHGLQLDGQNYLVPIDAKLLADRDVQDEAVPLDRVIAAVDRVRKFGLIVVDACRNNPFLTDMRFTVASRAAQTRGLARIQPQGTILVEFAARDGQLALDGDAAGNSPFAAALAKRLATPGLEVGKLLRMVREDVLATTARQQEPTFSGNIPAEDLFFRLPQ
jgi:hypothetical protein